MTQSMPQGPMLDEIEFNRYERRGAYHWEQISHSIRKHNAFVTARYGSVMSVLDGVREQLLLDIGGGDGVLSYLLARRHARVVTIDNVRIALMYAKEEFACRGLKARAVEGSAYAQPFREDTFDAVVCCDVIEHVQSPRRLLIEAAHVLKPDGLFVLTTPLCITGRSRDSTHVREFSADELADLLTPAFDQVTVKSFASLTLLDLFRKPFRRFGGRPLLRYLFNVVDIYLRHNLFAAYTSYRRFSMLIATARKR